MNTLSQAKLLKLQKRLKELGFDPGPIDGQAGPQTSAAIIAFKKANGLRPRDKVGPVTWSTLFDDHNDKSFVNGIPPLARPFLRRLGWHEKRDTAKLIQWFQAFGKYLGNPKSLPWCAEGVENAALEMFPNEPVPSNPFWARAWANYGVDAGGPAIGSIGVIGWKRGGHVGIVAAYDARTRRVTLIGANQGDMIKYSTFGLDNFIAFRVPPSEKGKVYKPFAGISKIEDYAATR